MKKILIADSSKASLVMTSEVFKDNYPGVQVLVAKTSLEAVELAKTVQDIEAFVIDFDLPDANGALTAVALKKITKKPILLTAFDREDVHGAVDALLSKHEDCRSWLKKPVNPDVVTAVVQRFCEGKIRLEQRISCQLPAFVDIELVNKPKKTTKKISTKSVEVPEETMQKFSFQGIIEDCSLRGAKLKPSKNSAGTTSNWASLLKQIEKLPKNSKIQLSLPSPLDIEIGKTTLQIHSQILVGKVVWTSPDTGEWYMGIEFEDTVLSKRLFEAVAFFYSKRNKMGYSQSMLKLNRAV